MTLTRTAWSWTVYTDDADADKAAAKELKFAQMFSILCFVLSYDFLSFFESEKFAFEMYKPSKINLICFATNKSTVGV